MGGRYNYSLGMLIPLPPICGSLLCGAPVLRALGGEMGRRPEESEGGRQCKAWRPAGVLHAGGPSGAG